jgi:predicted transposase YbfD/YdcC
VVTIDAMGCQKEIADLIREGGGDYVLAVKQNQPTLYEQVGEAIDAGLEQDAAALDEHQTVETGHGRQETRTYVIFPAPETVNPDGVWRDLSAVGMAITESTDAKGHCRLEARYYILSVLLTAKEFAEAVRGHWSIENNLHWQLDVSFREDECRVRTDHAPANLSVIRRFALGLLKRETSCRRGIETGADRLAASPSCSCCLRELDGGFASDLDDLATLKLSVALLLTPPHERFPVTVDLDATQQQHRLGSLLKPPHPTVIQTLADDVPRRAFHHTRGDH